MAYALKDNKIVELDKNEQADVELRQPSSFFSSHINLIPLQNNVQGPRLFYGARFMNQAMPLAEPEAPLVQNMADDDSGRSYDEIYGRQVGAVFANDDEDDAEVVDNDGDRLTLKRPDGTKRVVPLYKSFPFNRKSAIYNTSDLKKGDRVKAGQLLARSNYTDKNGTLAMGSNARVGLVPYKGWSMDDAIVLSESFAKKLASDHSYMEEMDFDGDTKGGKGHFISLFPERFTKKQMELVDDKGVVKPGTVLNQGDPMILATAPKAFNSTVGRLSKVMRQARSDRSTTWDHEEPGVVTDVAHTKDGVKVVIQSKVPTKQGDKVVFRSGQKGIVSKLIPDEQMPRTVDGKPLEVLLNPLGVPSRVNNSIIYELMLGKIAKAQGKPIKVPGFNKLGERRYEEILKMLDQAGLSDLEEVFDPTTNRKLENPVTVGDAYILKLHHVAESKSSSRSQGSYDLNEQPVKGGGAGAQSKRFSGLEVHSMLSAGAYKTLRESSTLRGQKNDEYWRQLRAGLNPHPPGEPFVWNKFRALLEGAGMSARSIGGGKMRLGPMTDAELESRKPIEVKNGKMVDLGTMEPEHGGLFDHTLVGSDKWGVIKLPHHVPNPAFENHVAHLLGITKDQLREVMAGRMELPERR